MGGLHLFLKYIVAWIVSLFLYQPSPFLMRNRTLADRLVRARPEGARNAVVFFHGNGGHAGEAQFLMDVCAEHGLAFYGVEYPGYGNSEPLPKSEGELFAAVDRAWGWVREDGFAPENTILWGHSMGSAPAVELASRHRVGGLVVQAGFASIFTVLNRRLGEGMRVLGLDVFPNVEKMGRVASPVVFVHASDDRLILPETNMEPNRRALSPEVPRDTVMIRGGHNASPSEQQTWEILRWVLDHSIHKPEI